MKVWGLLLLAVFTQGAFAHHEQTETISLSLTPFYLCPGETKTISLGNDWRKVESVIVQAIAYGSDATFEVMANGVTKGTVYVPKTDPSYIVTIAETTNSIQLRHVTGGKAYIQGVTVRQSTRTVGGPSYYPGYPAPYEPKIALPWYNEASYLAREAITLSDALQGYTNYKDYGFYLLPIKKVAGLCYADAQARGALSGKVRASLFALKKQIEFASPYLNTTFELGHAFELAVSLKELGNRLDQLLN